MGILSFTTVLAGQSGNFIGGNVPRRVSIVSSDNLAAVTTAGYLNNIVKESGNTLYPTDIIDMWYSYVNNNNPGTYEVFIPTFLNGVITLVLDTSGGDVLLPVVSGDFANFNGTTGQIFDAGFSPSNAAKTKVVMANGAVIANHIGVFTDTAGTLGQDAATAINGGNIQAGLSGTAGTLASFPATSSNGSFIFKAINNTGGFASTLSNSNIGQATIYSLPDPGAATANILVSASSGGQSISGGLTISTGNLSVSQGNVVAGSSGHAGTLTSFPGTASNGSFIIAAINNSGGFASTLSNSNIGQATVYSLPDAGAATANMLASGAALVSGDLIQASGTGGAVVDSGILALNVSIMKVFTLTFTQLATAGKVNIQVHPSGTSQYYISNIQVLTSAGLAGGDRLLAVTDGTLVWNNAGITAALLGTPIFTLWGGTGNPIAVSTSQVSTAGADIYFQYTGGTTDNTSGSVQIAVTYVKVTA